MNSVLVQIADQPWTIQAMHLAAAIARNNHARLLLLYLMPVKSPGLLGSELGTNAPNEEQYQAIREYASVAEDYGVEVTIQPMQFISWDGALAQAAEATDAGVVFARVPDSSIKLWRRFQTWTLKRAMAAQKRQFYTLEQPQQADEWAPLVTVKEAE